MDFLEITRQQLDYLENLASLLEKQTANLEGMTVQQRKVGRAVRYYAHRAGEKKDMYLNRKQGDLLLKLLAKRQKSRLMPAIQKNRRLLLRLLQEYQPPEPLFSTDLPDFPATWTAGATGNADLKNRKNTAKGTAASANQAENGSTPESAANESYRPQELRHITASGLRVRSKSEAIIATLLESYQIRFQYEKALRIQSLAGHWYTCHPDFTIFPPGRSPIYWEHLGMMDQDAYRKVAFTRVTDYYHNNILPPTNLILTMDGPDGSLDGDAIRQIIVGQLKPLFS